MSLAWTSLGRLLRTAEAGRPLWRAERKLSCQHHGRLEAADLLVRAHSRCFGLGAPNNKVTALAMGALLCVTERRQHWAQAQLLRTARKSSVLLAPRQGPGAL